jgi:hypothetical protein
MTRTLALRCSLVAALAAAGCGTSSSDALDTPLESDQPAPRARAVSRDVTIPSGTTLPLVLTSAVASDTSAIEDTVTAELTRPIAVDGRDVLPAGTRFVGIVTGADDSDRVKGRATISFRFTSLRVGDTSYDVTTEQVSRVAAATKGEDATKIGIGAGAGAVIGGLLGGKDGAAKGAVVGGGAGTGVVLATKGKEIRFGSGDAVTTRLTAPLRVRVRTS